MTELILKSELQAEFPMVHLDISDHREISNVGRFELTNVVLALKSVFQLAYNLVRVRPALVYLPIAKNRVGFLRDGLFILMARTLRRRIVIHFHASGFDDFYRAEPSVMRGFVRACLSGSRTHVIVLGECLRSQFDGLVPAARIHVVPNGILDRPESW